jgi:hypothetical protein
VAAGGGHSVDADWPELFERTAEMLGSKAKRQRKLLQFLLDQERRVASFEKLVTDFYHHKARSDEARTKAARAARRLAERLRENLDDKGCPLRLEIKDSTARLILENRSCRTI